MTSSFSRYLAFTIIVFTTVLISSCKDNDSPPSKRPLLIGKTWTVVQYEVDGIDVTNEREECETDNTTVFFEDGTFVDDVGSLLCEEFETDVDGTWDFKANETIISLRPAGESALDWRLLELSETTLKISHYVQALKTEILVVMEPR